MSIPVKVCLARKAACGDADAMKEFIKIMRYNWGCRGFSTWPCECTPKCSLPSPEQEQAFNDAVNAEFEKWRAEQPKRNKKASGTAAGEEV